MSDLPDKSQQHWLVNERAIERVLQAPSPLAAEMGWASARYHKQMAMFYQIAYIKEALLERLDRFGQPDKPMTEEETDTTFAEIVALVYSLDNVGANPNARRPNPPTMLGGDDSE